MRIPVGHLDDIPSDHCVAVHDGTVVVVRVDQGVVAFPNRCLHKDSPLDGGRVFGGALTCPFHFWRYRLPDGVHTGGRGALATYVAEVDHDGTVHVEVPEPAPALSLRERLLAHAREWERGA